VNNEKLQWSNSIVDTLFLEGRRFQKYFSDGRVGDTMVPQRAEEDSGV